MTLHDVILDLDSGQQHPKAREVLSQCRKTNSIKKNPKKQSKKKHPNHPVYP